MKKLNILLWVSLLTLFIACNHSYKEDETTAFKLTLSFSKTSCYTGDTLQIRVFVDDKPYSGKVSWNRPDIFHSEYEHLFIVPQIPSDSMIMEISAKLETQTVSQNIKILQRGFMKPLVSYQNTIQPLFTGNCNFSGCHGNGSRAGKVELSCYDSTMKSVAPYNANSSLVYIALIKTDPLRVMPPAGRLHDYKIEEVKSWIEQGAKNN
jgi:hypothetical protein